MSAISSSSSTDLYQFLQPVPGDSNQGTTSMGSSTTSGTVQGTGKHRRQGGGQLQNQIPSGVTQALQKNISSSSTNQLLQNAITNLLKANGSKLGPSGSQATPPQTGPTPDDPTATSTTEDQQQFTDLLQATGVDPQKFQANVQAALQEAQDSGSDSVDLSKAFAKFPLGSIIDTMA